MTSEVHEVAKGISDLGMMAMTAAFFLVLSAAMWILIVKWFKKMVDDMIQSTKTMMTDLLKETRKQNDMLNDISEGLRSETLLRIQHMSKPYFELAVEKVIKMIGRLRKENHLDKKPEIKKKIRTLLTNLHYDRKGSFDYFTFHGKKVAEYVNPEWIDWVAEVVESELYASDVNVSRIYTNVKAVYDKIEGNFNYRVKQGIVTTR